MKGLGKKTICTERVYTLGKMAEDMKENMQMIKSMDLVNTSGLTVVSILGCGIQVNNMVKASTLSLMVKKKKEFGKMEKEQLGKEKAVLKEVQAVGTVEFD